MDKVEHDFSAIEQALKQNEAPMRMRERIGRGGMAGLIILATGIAVTLAALGIGKGIFWAKEEKIVEVEVPVEKVVEVEKIVEVPVPAPSLPQPPAQSGGTRIARNFVIFQEIEDQKIGSRTWDIVVGHRYATSEQATYDEAYCYATTWTDDIQTRIDVSFKVPNQRPTEASSYAAAQKLNLGETDIAEMLSLCPYF